MSDKRTRQAGTRVTERDKKVLERRAAKCNLKLSEWIYRVLMNHKGGDPSLPRPRKAKRKLTIEQEKVREFKDNIIENLKNRSPYEYYTKEAFIKIKGSKKLPFPVHITDFDFIEIKHNPEDRMSVIFNRIKMIKHSHLTYIFTSVHELDGSKESGPLNQVWHYRD
jgi:hypothetical protein